LYASPNISSMIKSGRMRWVGHVACWEDNIRIYLREIWWEAMDWTHVAQDKNQWQATVITVINEW